ncbi:MAG TPA: hypothetical protein VIY52_00845 [Streptosporangiaceae bacterium]
MTMVPGPACCAGCGAPLRPRQGAWCQRCRQQGEAASCPGCGGSRLLLPGTGRRASCSRTCTDCGKVVRPQGRVRCSRCHRRAEPTRACRACGKLTVIVAHGLCDNCWQQDPARLAGQAERLAARLDDPPAWLDGFAAHAAARHCVGRTSLMISRLGRLLAETGKTTPQAILEQASRPGRSAGTLARALKDFFTDAGLAFPDDHAARREAARRQRRIQETPQPLRQAVARYAAALTTAQQRARRAGTRPRADRTLADDLAVLPDLALFLADRQDRLGHRPGRRPRGIPRRAPGKPGPAADHPQVVLPLGPGQPPHPCRSRRRDPRRPGPRLPPPHPGRRRAAAPVPPLDDRPGCPPARGADRPARAPARHARELSPATASELPTLGSRRPIAR